IPPAPSLSAYRDRRLAPGQQNARRGERLPVTRYLKRNARYHFAHVARFALDTVAEDMHRQACLPGHCGSRFERELRSCDEAKLARREATIAGLDALATATGQDFHHVRGKLDTVALDDGQRVG